MRVIAGSARGRRLATPPGHVTRPTADRVREALFSSIATELEGAVVLDLFAGSGALGIEALSRGAEYAVFVERERRAVRTIFTNLGAARLGARASVLEVDAARFCAQPDRRRFPRPFDVVFADPPYTTPDTTIAKLLGDLRTAGVLAPDALVVVERDRRDAGGQTPEGFDHLRDRTYGDTVLRYLRNES
jgi:16S rRNA (guanine966-N2)-methyltransferase